MITQIKKKDTHEIMMVFFLLALIFLPIFLKKFFIRISFSNCIYYNTFHPNSLYFMKLFS